MEAAHAARWVELVLLLLTAVLGEPASDHW